MRAMFGCNEETADDGKQNEYLLRPSAYDVFLRLGWFVHGWFLIAERSSLASAR
jgi:hypothetical protein